MQSIWIGSKSNPAYLHLITQLTYLLNLSQDKEKKLTLDANLVPHPSALHIQTG